MPAPDRRLPIDVVRWGRSRLGVLHALVEAAMPEEALLADDLEACCFDGAWPVDPPDATGRTVVLATAEDDAALSLVSRPGLTGLEAFVNLVVVHPDRRRRGRATALLDAAAAEARAWGADRLRLAGAAPFYLWPGVDVTNEPMSSCAAHLGFVSDGEAHDLVLSSATRAVSPEGVELRHVLDDADVAAVQQLVERHWPEWLAEVDRGISHASCLAAFASGARAETGGEPALGFCCHSVNRLGWLGPMGTDPAHGRRGVGAALVGAVCRDAQIAGLAEVEICWVGPDAFYESVGATPGRAYRTFTRRA